MTESLDEIYNEIAQVRYGSNFSSLSAWEQDVIRKGYGMFVAKSVQEVSNVNNDKEINELEQRIGQIEDDVDLLPENKDNELEQRIIQLEKDVGYLLDRIR